MAQKKHPVYRVVVADGRCTRDGRYIEQGWPLQPQHRSLWRSLSTSRRLPTGWPKGAQPTDTVVRLIDTVKKAQVVMAETSSGIVELVRGIVEPLVDDVDTP